MERKGATDEIRRLNADLETRVKQRTTELTETNEELQAFTYTVAHDLRAPLRHMQGFARFLQQDWYDRLDDRGRHCMDRILSSSIHMGLLLDDLLEFSRLRRVEMQTTRISLGKLVEQIRRDLEPELDGRALTWEVDTLPEVEGDPLLLNRVLVNLIDNSV